MYHIKNDKRNQTSCELIYQSLVKLTLEESFEQINIKTLTETAGVGRATFYRSFDTIEDVLKYRTDKVTQALSEWMYLELARRTTFSESDVFSLFFRFWFERTELLSTLIQAKRYWLLEGSFDNLFKTKLIFLKALLNADDHAWQYFIRIRTAILTSMLAEWIRTGKKETPDELVKILLRSFAHVSVRLDGYSSGTQFRFEVSPNLELTLK